MAAVATASANAKLKTSQVQVQYGSDSDSESDDDIGNVSDTSDSSEETGIKQKQKAGPKAPVTAEGSSSSGEDQDEFSEDPMSGGSDDDGDDADIDSVPSDNDDDQATEGNMGWADAMSKILGRESGDKQVILAKGQTDKEILKRKSQRKAEEAGETYVDEDERRRALQAKRAKKLEWESMARAKPDPLQKDRERALQRIATRGVVQLFNAVKKQQKVVSETLEGTKTESQKDKALRTLKKGEFLDMLKSDPVDKEDKERAKKQPWLSEDYMTKATIKDWTGNESDGDDEER